MTINTVTTVTTVTVLRRLLPVEREEVSVPLCLSLHWHANQGKSHDQYMYMYRREPISYTLFYKTVRGSAPFEGKTF